MPMFVKKKGCQLKIIPWQACHTYTEKNYPLPSNLNLINQKVYNLSVIYNRKTNNIANYLTNIDKFSMAKKLLKLSEKYKYKCIYIRLKIWQEIPINI